MLHGLPTQTPLTPPRDGRLLGDVEALKESRVIRRGPVEHLKTGCVNNHWLTPLAEMAERERPAALDRDLQALPT